VAQAFTMLILIQSRCGHQHLLWWQTAEIRSRKSFQSSPLGRHKQMSSVWQSLIGFNHSAEEKW